jgi:CheY-like chemotaxis protein
MANEPKILVVDDDEVLLDLMTRRLDKMGLGADRAENGSVGLKMIEENIYGLVISDIYMPGSTGIDVLKAAKAKDPTCQVITITGGATIEMALKALDEGAFMYLTKPFDHLRVFDHAVRRALEYRRLLVSGGMDGEAAPAALPAGHVLAAYQALENLPFPVLWLEKDGDVLVKNSQAEVWLEKGLSTAALAEKCLGLLRKSGGDRVMVALNVGGDAYRMLAVMVREEQSRKTLLVSILPSEPKEENAPMAESRGDAAHALDEPIDLLKKGLAWLYQQRLHEREFRVIRGLARQVQTLESMRRARAEREAGENGRAKNRKVRLPSRREAS